MLLDFEDSKTRTKSLRTIARRLRIAGSWFKRPDSHRWTWYSNSGGARKETDYVLVGGCWRFVQNCRVSQCAEFAGTDHILLEATLKIRFKSCNVRFLRDESVAQEYKRELAECLEEPDDFNETKVLKLSVRCLRDIRGNVQEVSDQGDHVHHPGESHG